MQIVKFVISGLILVGLIYLLDTHGLGNASTPALGRLLAPATGVWQQAEPAETSMTSTTVLSEVQGSVVYDEHGIPHVFAATIKDAAYLQGYAHARDRLFQMDMSTRATAGRLAEILGPSLVERDRTQRRKGLLEAARLTADQWLKNKESRELLLAYRNGVNAYLDQLSHAAYPVEYKLLGFAPEQWTVLRSALFS